MEPPKFYLYARASGLVETTLLDEVLQRLDHRPSDGIGIRDDAVRAVDVAQLQHSARLRDSGNESPSDDSGEDEPIDAAGASLDGETEDRDRATDLDRRFADELVRLGALNRWQAVQLLQGRTKFTLGGYRVLDAIGKGGYGHVFLGRATGEPSGGTARFVALKVLPLARATAELTTRFLHEIDVQKDVEHPNLARFLDSGRDGNVHYMVHEFVDGGDLRMLLRREGPLPFEIAAAVVSHLAEALQYLHGHGIVHRDVKPGNVLLSSDGTAKLSDMGLAVRIDGVTGADPELIRSIESRTAATNGSVLTSDRLRIGSKTTGKVAGTVDYMAPDQIRDPSTPAASWDIYSLGCTFYQLLTGTVPFPRQESRLKFRAHLEAVPPDPRIVNQAIPFDVIRLLREMLEKDPGKRIRSAGEIAERLAPWIPPPGLADRLVFQDRQAAEALPPPAFKQRFDSFRP